MKHTVLKAAYRSTHLALFDSTKHIYYFGAPTPTTVLFFQIYRCKSTNESTFVSYRLLESILQLERLLYGRLAREACKLIALYNRISHTVPVHTYWFLVLPPFGARHCFCQFGGSEVGSQT
jgi:hypothetical protein